MNRRSASGYEFDHGAQYLTAKDPRFARYVQAWVDDGVLRWWAFRELSRRTVKSGSGSRLVGDGSMRRLAEHLAQDLTVRLETRVGAIQSRTVVDVEGKPLGEFDRIVVTAPLAQARELLTGHPTLASALGDAGHDPCWCVMARWHEPICHRRRRSSRLRSRRMGGAQREQTRSPERGNMGASRLARVE